MKLGQGFARSAAFLVAVSLSLGPSAWADLPQQGVIQSGEGTISYLDADTLDVNQLSDKLVVDWGSFDLALGKTVNFFQPSLTASILNNVVGGGISHLNGNINANGIVWLSNPAGILIGSTANINAAAFLASTLRIQTQDYLANNYLFSNDPNIRAGYLFNKGKIVAKEGGYVALLGGAVGNEGLILAPLGSVALASGNKMTVGTDSKGLISVALEAPITETIFDQNGASVQSGVSNSGTLLADGGKVLLTASALEGVFQNAVNHTGLIQANRIEEKNGEVYLFSDDRVHVGGIVNAEGGTLTVDSQGATYDGTLVAKTGLFNAHGGDTFLDQADISGADMTFLDNIHIFVVGDLSVTGNLTIKADNDNNGTGVFEQAAGTTISAGGNIDIQASDVYIHNAFFGGDSTNTFTALAKSGEIKVGNYTDHLNGTYVDAVNYPAPATAVGDGKIISAVGGLQTFSDTATASGFIDEAQPDTVNTSGNKFQVQNGTGSQKWGWVEFDVSFLQGLDLFIESGLVTLLSSGSSSGKSVNVYDALDDWGGDGSHTWNNQPTVDPIPLGGSGTIAVNNDPVIVDFGSELQQDLLSSDSGIATLIIKRTDSASQVLEFWNHTAPATKNRPILEVTYYELGLGDISLTANGNGAAKTDIALGRLVTKGDVTVDSKQGAILDANGNKLNVIAANNLLASAVTGIGSADFLETGVSNLSAKNTTSGNIYIDNAGDIVLTDLGGFGALINTAPFGAITLNAASIITVDAPVETLGGNIALSASEDIIQNAGGDITIHQVDGTLLGAPTQLSVQPGDLHLTGLWQSGISNDNTVDVQWQLPDVDAASASYTATAGGAYTMNGSSQITTHGGNVTIDANGNVQVNVIDAGNGEVSVTSATGAITDANGVSTNLYGHSFDLSAATGSPYTELELSYPQDIQFSFLWDQSPGTIPNASADAFLASLSGGEWIFSPVSAVVLPDGVLNTFHVATTDGVTAPDVSQAAHLGAFWIDTTAPLITALRSIAPNVNGWNNTPVTVSYSYSDGLSGPDLANPGTDVGDDVFSGEGAGQSASGTIFDLAGNSASAIESPINIDLTAPLITANPSGTQDSSGVWITPVTVRFDATDSLSGLAPTGASTLVGFDTQVADQNGIDQLLTSALVTDLAGNSAGGVFGPFTLSLSSPVAAVFTAPLLIPEDIRFRIPPRPLLDQIRVSHAVGPSSLVAPQAFFYPLPLEVAGVQEVIEGFGETLYDFIDGRIQLENPALAPLLQLDFEQRKKKP